MWLLQKLKYTCNSSIVFNNQVKKDDEIIIINYIIAPIQKVFKFYLDQKAC
jgi:hypothetical protein